MNKSVEKFKKYLEKLVEASKEKICDDYIKTARKHINKNVSVSVARAIAEKEVLKKYKKNGYIQQYSFPYDLLKKLETKSEDSIVKFTDFKKLSELLLASDLSSHEMFEVVKYVLKKNWQNQSDNTKSLEYKEIKNLKMPSMTEKEFFEYVSGKRFVRFLNASDEELNAEELTLRRKLDEILCNPKKQNPSMIVQKIIKKHYFDKEKYNEKDIQIICKAFRCLGIVPKLCESFQFLLNKEFESKKSLTVSFCTTTKKEEKVKIDQKEYDYIFREIESYYNVQEQRVIKPLTLDEIIYVASLMFKINIKESEIAKYIQIINKEGLNAYSNPLSYFNAYYEKILAFSDNPEITKALEAIKMYLSAMFIPYKDDFIYGKKEIANELKNIMPIINKEYQYELELGRKRSM